MASNVSIKPQDLVISDGALKVYISIDIDGKFSIDPAGMAEGFEFIGSDPKQLEDLKRTVALIDRAIDFIQSQYEQAQN